MNAYLQLTKFGIIVFVLITGAAGFALSYHSHESFVWGSLFVLLLGLYFLSAGSFALNQAQEWQLDRKMPRTFSRPIPSGIISPFQAYLIAFIFIITGSFMLSLLSLTSMALGLFTVALYNGLYTLYWKKKWAFGAVPGAIPGAMPVVIGYSANHANVFTPECMYLFLIMFLWQMPHFWSLAIRYKDDYKKGGFPVLPAVIGVPKTLFHIGLYTFTYIGFALASPWFVQAHVSYIVLVLPFAFMVLWAFFKYYQAGGHKKWLPFFLWVNFSLIAFVVAPVIDKWVYLLKI
ncbi:MAG: protoheme IX farnesyltransferase [Bdellovibrionales bacterium]|nr:protoheme IX farnesyltransferase [Bdellovibrionales bacterium]